MPQKKKEKKKEKVEEGWEAKEVTVRLRLLVGAQIGRSQEPSLARGKRGRQAQKGPHSLLQASVPPEPAGNTLLTNSPPHCLQLSGAHFPACPRRILTPHPLKPKSPLSKES